MRAEARRADGAAVLGPAAPPPRSGPPRRTPLPAAGGGDGPAPRLAPFAAPRSAFSTPIAGAAAPAEWALLRRPPPLVPLSLSVVDGIVNLFRPFLYVCGVRRNRCFVVFHEVVAMSRKWRASSFTHGGAQYCILAVGILQRVYDDVYYQGP